MKARRIIEAAINPPVENVTDDPTITSAPRIRGTMATISNRNASAKLDVAEESETPSRAVTIQTYDNVPIRAGNRSLKRFLTSVVRNRAVLPTFSPTARKSSK